jgi:hypothetical protein
VKIVILLRNNLILYDMDVEVKKDIESIMFTKYNVIGQLVILFYIVNVESRYINY